MLIKCGFTLSRYKTQSTQSTSIDLPGNTLTQESLWCKSVIVVSQCFSAVQNCVKYFCLPPLKFSSPPSCPPQYYRSGAAAEPIYLKPMHNIGKVSVNASILYKNQEICNKTNLWKFQLISLFLLRENSKNAFSIFVFILMAGDGVMCKSVNIFVFRSYQCCPGAKSGCTLLVINRKELEVIIIWKLT